MSLLRVVLLSDVNICLLLLYSSFGNLSAPPGHIHSILKSRILLADARMHARQIALPVKTNRLLIYSSFIIEWRIRKQTI